MQLKTLISIAIAGAFATSLAQADDKSATSGASGSSANPGAEKMFQALDKNKDGFLSREEVQGTPHAKDFDTLDKNRDGKLSRDEHAAAPEHQAEKSGSSSTSGATSSPSASPSGSAASGDKKY